LVRREIVISAIEHRGRPAAAIHLELAVEALGRPYPVTASMVLLVGLVPLYIFIPELVSQDAAHSLDTAVDRLFHSRRHGRSSTARFTCS
jgi:hypothetical protein